MQTQAETKWTRGPWSVQNCYVIDSEKNYVAEVYSDNGADDHLIAAAPSMFEALEAALWVLDNMTAILNHAKIEGTMTDPRPQIRGALSKARGEL